MLGNFSHLQLVKFSVQIGDKVTAKVGIFNQNKLPTGVAIQCIETDTYNPYLLTMTQEHFEALFLDDGSLLDPQSADADHEDASSEIDKE